MHDYIRPSTLSEALALRAGGAHILAGGTDLYPSAAQALPGRILDVTRLAPLQGIEVNKNGVRIGACTLWADIVKADLPPAFAALQQAALQIGGRQIQNAGTIGGNLCNASPAADGVPPLLAMGADVEIASNTATRRMALDAFIAGPRKTSLAADEIMVAIHIPPMGMIGRSSFMKLGARAYLVISIAMVAVRIVVERGLVVDVALAVGSCSGVATRLRVVEEKLLHAPADAAAGLITDADVANCLAPIDDIRATRTYRAGAAAELLRRAVVKAAA